MTAPAETNRAKLPNRTFHPDDFPAWFDEVESLWGSRITEGALVDDLYEAYLANDTPMQAVFGLRGLQAGPWSPPPVPERLSARTVYVAPPTPITTGRAAAELVALTLIIVTLWVVLVWGPGGFQ